MKTLDCMDNINGVINNGKGISEIHILIFIEFWFKTFYSTEQQFIVFSIHLHISKLTVVSWKAFTKKYYWDNFRKQKNGNKFQKHFYRNKKMSFIGYFNQKFSLLKEKVDLNLMTYCKLKTSKRFNVIELFNNNIHKNRINYG